MKRAVLFGVGFLAAVMTAGLPVLGQATVAEIGQVAVGTEGMVAAAHPLAAEVGARILALGGNAVDAAVAMSFTLGVVEPYASGLGGEGYMIVALTDGTQVAVDFRSWAPGQVTKETPVNSYGPKSVCIPGTLAAMDLVLTKYGTMTLSEVLAPAIELAENGFPVDSVFVTRVLDAYKDLSDPNYAEVGKVFLADGLVPEEGSIFKNPDLAYTLRLLADGGAQVFYEGEIAQAIVDATGGWITMEDMAAYRAVEREPVHGTYRGYEILSAPPIVAGVVVVEALNIIEHFNLARYGRYDHPTVVHIIAEALKLAFADRDPVVGDPDFYDVPVIGLTSKEFAAERVKFISLDSAIVPAETPVGDPWPYNTTVQSTDTLVGAGAESGCTTHVSVVDKDGNAVSLTQTLSSFWGSRIAVPGYGFILNNEYTNFNAYRKDRPDDINVAGPYKRPRTVIAPTILLDRGEVFLVIGTPGAGRIPGVIVETVVNVVDFCMNLEDAITAPKYYSRNSVKNLEIEGGFSPELIAALQALGHQIKEYGPLDVYFGGTNAVMVLADGTMIGVADIRRLGGAAAP
ncbi:MAG: gamma-glutamyltransferase [Candidatus Bipolaricaulis sp.]|nr:gamma-glutamyltransferase [Candidatus Bipolaricaulis sp.]